MHMKTTHKIDIIEQTSQFVYWTIVFILRKVGIVLVGTGSKLKKSFWLKMDLMKIKAMSCNQLFIPYAKLFNFKGPYC